MLNSGVKSQLLYILEHGINITYEEPNTDTVIIDGAALVNAKPLGQPKRLMIMLVRSLYRTLKLMLTDTPE